MKESTDVRNRLSRAAALLAICLATATLARSSDPTSMVSLSSLVALALGCWGWVGLSASDK